MHMVFTLNIAGVSPESRNTMTVRSAEPRCKNDQRLTSSTSPQEKHRLPSLPGEMPITELYLPVLSRFLCAVEMTTGLPPQPLDATPEQLQRVEQQENEKKALPKGVVLGPDGKP
jgi:hypothetical protein